MKRMEFIRKTGNFAAHIGQKVKKEQAELCLQNLYIFLDFVAYCYADHYTASNYDSTLLQENSVHTADQSVSQPVGDRAGQSETDLKLEQLLKENAALREELTARRRTAADIRD